MGEIFKFKMFQVHQDRCTMKVNTDGILLGAWTNVINKRKSLDIGTGTGIIALMIAQRAINIHSHAIEIDQNAYLQSASNMANSIFNERLCCYHQSIQDFAKESDQKYDLIVSNPPFFSGGTFSLNENRARVRHTIKLSHYDLLSSVRSLLMEDGHFDLILPYLEGLRFIEMASKYDFGAVHLTEVKSRPDKPIERLLIRFGVRFTGSCTHSTLIIHQSALPNDYTDEMIGLTKDFYLFM